MANFDFNSSAFQDFLRILEEKFDLPNNELSVIASIESAGNPKVVSNKNAKGLFQFTDETAQDFGVDDPFNPFEAAVGAARKLSSDLKKFGDINLARAAYNAGTGAVQKFGGIPPFKETQNYVAKANQLSARLSGNAIEDTIFTSDNPSEDSSLPEDFNPFLTGESAAIGQSIGINPSIPTGQSTTTNQFASDNLPDDFNPFLTKKSQIPASTGTQLTGNILPESQIPAPITSIIEARPAGDTLPESPPKFIPNMIFERERQFPEIGEGGRKGIERTLAGPVQTALQAVAPELGKRLTEIEAQRQKEFDERIKSLPEDVQLRIAINRGLGGFAPFLFVPGGSFLKNTALGGLFDFSKFSEDGKDFSERSKDFGRGAILSGALDLLLRGTSFVGKEISKARAKVKTGEAVLKGLSQKVERGVPPEEIPTFEDSKSERFVTDIANFFRVGDKTAAATAASLKDSVKSKIVTLKKASSASYSQAKDSVDGLLDDILLNSDDALKKFGGNQLVRDTIAQGSIPTPKAIQAIRSLRANHLKINSPGQADQTFLAYLDDLEKTISPIPLKSKRTIELGQRPNIDFDFLRNQITKPNSTIEEFYKKKGREIVPDQRIIEILPLQNALKEDLENFASLNPDAKKAVTSANKLFADTIAPLKTKEVLIAIANNAGSGDDIVQLVKNAGPADAQLVYNHLTKKGRSNLVAALIDDATLAAKSKGIFNEDIFLQTLQQSQASLNVVLKGSDKEVIEGTKNLMLHVMSLDEPGVFGALLNQPTLSIFTRTEPGIRVIASINRFRNKPGTEGFSEELRKFTPQIIQAFKQINEQSKQFIGPPELTGRPTERPPRLIERPTERPSRPESR